MAGLFTDEYGNVDYKKFDSSNIARSLANAVIDSPLTKGAMTTIPGGGVPSIVNTAYQGAKDYAALPSTMDVNKSSGTSPFTYNNNIMGPRNENIGLPSATAVPQTNKNIGIPNSNTVTDLQNINSGYKEINQGLNNRWDSGKNRPYNENPLGLDMSSNMTRAPGMTYPGDQGYDTGDGRMSSSGTYNKRQSDGSYMVTQNNDPKQAIQKRMEGLYNIIDNAFANPTGRNQHNAANAIALLNTLHGIQKSNEPQFHALSPGQVGYAYDPTTGKASKSGAENMDVWLAQKKEQAAGNADKTSQQFLDRLYMASNKAWDAAAKQHDGDPEALSNAQHKIQTDWFTQMGVDSNLAQIPQSWELFLQQQLKNQNIEKLTDSEYNKLKQYHSSMVAKRKSQVDKFATDMYSRNRKNRIGIAGALMTPTSQEE